MKTWRGNIRRSSLTRFTARCSRARSTRTSRANWKNTPAKSWNTPIKIAKQVDYFGGMPGVAPKPVKTSKDAEEMLRADLENERETVAQYRQRIRQAEAMGEFALSEILREIIVQEQEHEIDLCDALGIEVPEPKEI